MVKFIITARLLAKEAKYCYKSAPMNSDQLNNNPLLLRSLRGEKIERFPVWMMRQAGRYMPEYRAMKERYSFLEMCLTPEISTEVALQPIKAFDLDAAILFSDIMIPAKALGFQIDFAPGPVVRNPITTVDDIHRLPAIPDLNELSPVFSALKLLKQELKAQALIGFAATPFTLACYLLNQKPFKHFERSLIWIRKDPENFKRLLESLTSLTLAYVLEQIKSGAQVIQLFDSWGGILPKDLYQEFSLTYSDRIFAVLQKQAEGILYLNGALPYLELLEISEARTISIDSKTELTEAEAQLPSKGLQGNLDSSALFSSDVPGLTKEMLLKLKRSSRFVANLGHGILQETPLTGAQEFVTAVKEFKIGF